MPPYLQPHPFPTQDGHFVPNMTFGAPIVKCLRKHSPAFFDCHLMVSHPQQWVADFAAAGADMYTFHIEAAAEGELENRKNWLADALGSCKQGQLQQSAGS